MHRQPLFNRQCQSRCGQLSSSFRSWIGHLLMTGLCLGMLIANAHAQYSDSLSFGELTGPAELALESPDAVPIDVGPDMGILAWNHGSGICCGDCPPAWRVRAEGVLLNYEGSEGVTLSHGMFLSDFGYEEGARLTLVRHRDCLDAWELSYLGPFEWNEFGQVAGAGLGSRLSSTTVNLSEFNNASFHSQAYRTQLNSVELNRRWYGWDVISTLAGVRYINVDEDFLFNSTGAVSTGSLDVETNNHMAGPQIGLELMYPLGNWMTTAQVKGALMANSADANVRLVNAGVVEVAGSDDDLELSAVVELGYYFTYQLTPSIRLRGGYEFWWLYGFAAAPSQVVNPISTATGSNLEDDDAYYHGATAGIEIVW